MDVFFFLPNSPQEQNRKAENQPFILFFFSFSGDGEKTKDRPLQENKLLNERKFITCIFLNVLGAALSPWRAEVILCCAANFKEKFVSERGRDSRRELFCVVFTLQSGKTDIFNPEVTVTK